MPDRLVIHPSYTAMESQVMNAIQDFGSYSDILGDAERNVIKIIPVQEKKLTVKSFKIPNLVNQIVYRFFRKSKAERSYNYANALLELGIKTPFPVGYCISASPLLFKKSYYVSELVTCDLTYRELTTDFDISDHEDILRAFTRFTYELHKNGVNFLDHSPGNTLIKRKDKSYEFYLVDLNRMEFGKMNFETRIKNFARLTIHKSMIKVMSNEYAKCTGEDEDQIFNLMWQYTSEFQNRYHNKRKLKRKIFFWKKKYRD
ncbi:lipopolysaccharide kinase InaA family protein [Aquimarina sp. 2201CG5-10]|uniref:lipopolysaccharide kinase InaA family protein n=1 Tax=Aquimarina callyspongiae TaxID=3098150 RepID=UPI002AB52756|nr:lipopolysaccharide kinase InaA family protein [Aquimarina sp. 2201CG5-10]MDY8134009.1 lipopolysaccharide kinase InaA family protein [Aquimarina sp. 2201CG5-10]